MPKNEKGSPKEIANRIKSKGLQKLRWYCQMCQKQCRDQNGFKCHLMSESHQRQLLLFAENPNAYLSDFSTDFEKGFLDLLRRQFGTKRVRANMVYQEYIKDKHHIHMNSTKWMTLTGFVQYLGRAGIAKIDHTEKGWYIAYIDRAEEERAERAAKKVRMDQDDEERMRSLIEAQAQRALEQSSRSDEPELCDEDRKFVRASDDDKVGFRLGFKREAPDEDEDEPKPKINPLDLLPSSSSQRKRSESASSDASSSSSRSSKHKEKHKPALSALDQIKVEEEFKREMRNRKDHWLMEGIVVKIVTKKVGDEYYKQKGIVNRVVDKYAAQVELISKPGAVLKLDQTHLETVIPAVGRRILIVNGAYRSSVAVLDSIDTDKFAVNCHIDEGPLKGRKLEALPYEDVSKLAA